MTWQSILRQNFTCWQKLADFLQLTDAQRAGILPSTKFALHLPLRLAQKIRKGTLDDPILRQFLPIHAETVMTAGFGCDSVGDVPAQCTPKLLKKYEGRVLLICTSACAMHCRYCFRQHYDYDVGQPGVFEPELEFIRNDPTVHEVILSGGDPLSLPNRVLKQLLTALAAMTHVRRIRWHTRFPIGIPERIDAELLTILQSVPQTHWVVVHVNHPDELDADVIAALGQLRRMGAVVLNQAVLLKGVNDNIDTLTALSEKLVDSGILPYYLHQLDRTQGVAHFEVPLEQGRALIAELMTRIAGYAVPKYVQEIAGERHKTGL